MSDFTAEILVISVSVVAVVVAVAVFICLKIDQKREKKLARQKKLKGNKISDGGWSVKKIEDNYEAVEKEKNTESEEEKIMDDIAVRVIQDNKKREERQKPEENEEIRTKEILEEKSALGKIIIENWQATQGKGHCGKKVILKRKKLLKHKDIAIRTNEERMRIILDGINTDIIPTSELLEKYVVFSLKVLAEEGTSRPDNKERLKKILKKIDTIIVNPPEHEQYVVINALGELSKKKITIRTNGECLKKALEKIQNTKKFWLNSKKISPSLTNTLKEQEEESITIHIFGYKPEKLPNHVHIRVENIEGLERVMYLLIDLNEKERKILNKWIFTNYKDRCN